MIIKYSSIHHKVPTTHLKALESGTTNFAQPKLYCVLHPKRPLHAIIDALAALRYCVRVDKYDHRACAGIGATLLVLSERADELLPPSLRAALEVRELLTIHAGFNQLVDMQQRPNSGGLLDQ